MSHPYSGSATNKYVMKNYIQGIHLIASWALISKPVTQAMAESF